MCIQRCTGICNVQRSLHERKTPLLHTSTYIEHSGSCLQYVLRLYHCCSLAVLRSHSYLSVYKNPPHHSLATTIAILLLQQHCGIVRIYLLLHLRHQARLSCDRSIDKIIHRPAAMNANGKCERRKFFSGCADFYFIFYCRDDFSVQRRYNTWKCCARKSK